MQRLAETGLPLVAARSCGLKIATVRAWKQKNPEFSLAWIEATQAYRESLEHEAYRRAVNGTLRPVYYKGNEVGSVREYSDRLLELLLRANDPQKYGNRSQVDIDVRRGVMVLAPPTPTEDDWISAYGGEQDDTDM